MGSHTDSVPHGGNYDGDVGVMGGIEVAQQLHDRHVRLRHTLEVVDFTDEEGGLVGSRAMIAPDWKELRLPILVPVRLPARGRE